MKINNIVDINNYLNIKQSQKTNMVHNAPITNPTEFKPYTLQHLQANFITFGAKFKKLAYADIIEKIIKNTDDKQYRGLAIFDEEEKFVEWQDKIGYNKLREEPLNYSEKREDSDFYKDYFSYMYSNALAETKGGYWKDKFENMRYSVIPQEQKGEHWVRRFNNLNTPGPLALWHTVSGPNAKKDANKLFTKLQEYGIEDENSFYKTLRENNFLNDKVDGISFSEYQESKKVYLKELLKTTKLKELDKKIINPNTNKLNFNFTVFDTETTGIQIYPNKRPNLPAYNNSDEEKPIDKILQIGAVKYENGIVDPHSTIQQYIDPEIPIPQGAIDVHKITKEKLEENNAPIIDKVLTPFVENYIKNDIIVAYNSKFDVTLLNNAIRHYEKENKITLEEKEQCLTLDPFVLLQRIHPYIGAKKKLSDQYRYIFGTEMEGAHDATADVKGTADVLKYCLYYLQDKASKNGKNLTVKDVLTFQHGGIVKGIGIDLDEYSGADKTKMFNKSYVVRIMGINKIPKGYSFTRPTNRNPNRIDTLKQIEKEIGPKNSEIIKEADKYFINRSEPYKLNTFIDILKNYNIEGYGDLSKEEVMGLIIDTAECTSGKEFMSIWMKNINPYDMPDGNDLPSPKIARKVMLERIEEDNLSKDIDYKTIEELI